TDHIASADNCYKDRNMEEEGEDDDDDDNVDCHVDDIPRLSEMQIDLHQGGARSKFQTSGAAPVTRPGPHHSYPDNDMHKNNVASECKTSTKSHLPQEDIPGFGNMNIKLHQDGGREINTGEVEKGQDQNVQQVRHFLGI
ncbi:hypothetical protein RRG08_066732, partial [Elysia crispata]